MGQFECAMLEERRLFGHLLRTLIELNSSMSGFALFSTTDQ